MPDSVKQGKETVPSWLLSPNEIHSKNGKSSRGFLTKSLKNLSFVIQTEVFAEQFVRKKGYLQAVEPRVKLVTILFYLLLCAVTKSGMTLVLLAFLAGVFIKLSALDLRDYLKRVWLVIPPLVFVLSLPAATNWFIQGEPFFYIYRGAGDSLFLSAAGLGMILKMSVRIGVSLSFAYLLVLSTGWTAIARALAVLKVPSLFITLLYMTYRFLFLLTKIAAERMEARLLRTVGKVGNRSNRRFVAQGISYLFLKANFLSNELYDAMRCRGFSGEMVNLKQSRLNRADGLWIGNHIIILFVLWMGERFY